MEKKKSRLQRWERSHTTREEGKTLAEGARWEVKVQTNGQQGI